MDQYTLHKEIVVDASQEKAFRVFTEGFDSWWPRGHHIGGADMKEAVLEQRLGGRWYEKGVDGSECEWGTVLVWEPPVRFVVAWQLTAEWKYDPNFVTELEVSFVSQGPTRTLVILEHKNLDRYGKDWEKVKDSIGSDEGWGALLRMFAEQATNYDSPLSPEGTK